MINLKNWKEYKIPYQDESEDLELEFRTAKEKEYEIWIRDLMF